MNSKSVLGDAMPTGRNRIIWNSLDDFGNGSFWIRIRMGTLRQENVRLPNRSGRVGGIGRSVDHWICFISAKTIKGCLVMSQWISISDARKLESVGPDREVRGWVRTRRDSKGGFSFLEINDGSCFGNLQVVRQQDSRITLRISNV